SHGVHVVGDVMAEAVELVASCLKSTVLGDLGVEPKRYLLMTIHRAENTDKPERLRALVGTLEAIGEPVIFPIHPRTKKSLNGIPLPATSRVRCIDPLGYADMIALERDARLILTDSGGIQKEAYW